MNAFVLWLLLGVVGILVDMRSGWQRQPATFRKAVDEHPFFVAGLALALICAGPLTLAGSLAMALPRRE